MNKHCLILAGGGARVFIQAGILKQWLQDNQPPDFILGVSAGAILGAVYSQDKLDLFFSQLRALTKDELVFKFRPLNGFGKDAAFLDPHPLWCLINRHVIPHQFKIPIYAVLTNWTTVTSTTVNLATIDNPADWILASASAPAAFPPYRVNGFVYGDGGCMDNFPLDFACSMGATEITIMTGVAPTPSNFNNALDALSAYFGANDFTQENIEKRLVYFFSSNLKEKIAINFYGPTKSSGINLLDFAKAGKRANELFAIGAEIAKGAPVRWIR